MKVVQCSFNSEVWIIGFGRMFGAVGALSRTSPGPVFCPLFSTK